MTELSARRATLPSGDVLGVVGRPAWPPCVVLVDVSGSVGSAGVERALTAANEILGKLPARRRATAIAYAQHGVLSGLLARAPRPPLERSALEHVGLRVTRDQAGWDLARRELNRLSGGSGRSPAAEVIWISDFTQGARNLPGGGEGARVHLLRVSGLEPAQQSVAHEIGPRGEVPADLLAELQQDPGDLQVHLDLPGRWFTWVDGALESGPAGATATLEPAAGSLAWVAAPHAKARVVGEGVDAALGFADGPPDPDVLNAVREVSQ